ncbi:MAG: hypothetical protein WAQ28_14870 [Bacteroidia bacterium]
MKNKKLTYILIPLVAGLWGTILYKIFHTVNNKNNDFVINANILTGSMKSESAIDTFTINPDYNDPFLGKGIKKPVPSGDQIPAVVNTTQVKKPEKQAPAQPALANWPGIIYNGIVKNQKSNKQLAMIQVNGQASIMQEGDVTMDLKLLHITKDSIELMFQNEKKIFKK